MRIRFSVGLVVFAVILTIPIFGSAQGKEITQKEYWAAVYAAYSSSRKIFPRQELETYQGFTNGNLIYQREMDAKYRAADRYHTIKTRTEGAKRSVEETIQIGTERYCKRDIGAWMTTGCYDNPPAPLETSIDSTFRMHKTDSGIIYTRSTTFLLEGKAEPTKALSEDRLVLNVDLSIRERTITKSVFDTKVTISRETLKRDYRQDLGPIEAPIK